MKKIFTLLALFYVGTTFTQVLNFDFVNNSKFSGSPYIGASGGIVKEINDGLCFGGNVGLRFFTGSTNSTVFQIPLMGELRYFVNGSVDGFYPFAKLGFLYHYFKASNQFITISGSGTYLSFALGAGFKVGNLDLSLRYENIQFKIGHADLIGIRGGFWLGDSGKGKKRRR